MEKTKKKIYILALASHGKGISGGDRICIEFARRWSKKVPVTIYQETEGHEMFKRQGLVSSIKYQVSSIKGKGLGFLFSYFAKIILGIKFGLTLRLPNSSDTIIYSASEFWMDSLPAFILKLRFPKIKWVASWYQTSPNPLKGFAEGDRNSKYRLNVLLYWLSQLPIKPLIANFADFVLVNNEEEKKQFPSLNKKDRALVVIGAVDVERISKWQMARFDARRANGKLKKKYDAVFQGRFHPQKGVVELINIWQKVVDKKPDAKLAMIGDGPLMRDVRFKIKDLRLEKNIDLLGYVFDGDKKYKTFAQSKIVVHPAFYDSGGMASAEAMTFGLPCVGFNLASYQSYYPYGMIKVKIGDMKQFADTIIILLEDKQLRNKMGKEAVTMIHNNWSWDIRAKNIFELITS